MSQNSNLLSISAVHRLTGKARSTIGKHMKSGDLAFQIDEKGNKLIEASEVARVYDVKFDLDDDGQLNLDTKRSEKLSGVSSQSDSVLLEQMKEQRKLMNANIEDLRTNLEKALEREDKQMLLLTHQSETVDTIKEAVREEIREMRKELTAQEDHIKELRDSLAAQEIATRKTKMLLKAEKDRTWVDRLFKRSRGAG